MAKAKVNKSDVIRKILNDIGAISKDAPEGWAKTVTTKLEAKGIKVSAPMIYQLRTNERVHGVIRCTLHMMVTSTTTRPSRQQLMHTMYPSPICNGD